MGFKFPFTPEVAVQYQRLFDTCVINLDKLFLIKPIVTRILKGKDRYEALASRVNIPWHFIGITHSLEADNDFKSHLHNGDPLGFRTVNDPKGRPRIWNPPTDWESSAVDALSSFANETDWSVPAMLYKLEGYNGYGYHRSDININSPYLWSFSNHYTKGKFVRDHEFSPTAVSKQCGAAILLRRLTETQAAPVEIPDRISLIKQLGETVTFAPTRVVEKARELQKMLNLAGAHLLEDGKAGNNTSDAYQMLTGKFLPGDPRRV